MQWVHPYAAVDLAIVGIAYYQPGLVTQSIPQYCKGGLGLGRTPVPTQRLIKEASRMNQEYKWVVTWQ